MDDELVNMVPFSTDPYPLPGGYTVDFTFNPVRGLEVAWTPKVPKNLSASLLSAYRSARTAFLGEVEAQRGIRVAVIEF